MVDYKNLYKKYYQNLHSGNYRQSFDALIKNGVDINIAFSFTIQSLIYKNINVLFPVNLHIHDSIDSVELVCDISFKFCCSGFYTTCIFKSKTNII